MRLLLDTQIALWWLVGDRKLKRVVRERIAGAECAVSVASIWEVAIKHRIGKLPVAPDAFATAMRECGASVLPVSEAHATAYGALPAGHADPVDLMLLAVAQTEKRTLMTADGALQRYAEGLSQVVVEAAN